MGEQIVRVLVSGSSGFIGAALIDRLRALNHTVFRLTRPEGTGEAFFDLPHHTIATAGIEDGLAGIDAVFHLVGEAITPLRWSSAKRERIRSSRVVTTDAVARAIAASKGPPPVLVSMSAIGIYGDRGDEVLDEASGPGVGTLADICRAWEAATEPAADAGGRVVSMRSGIVLGQGGGSLRLQLPIFRLGLGGRLGSGRQWTSWIAIDDVVAALLHAATDPTLAGACNMTAPTPVRNRDFTAALGAALHRPALAVVPRPLLELAAGRETTSEFLCASQRAIPRALERSGFTFTHPELDAALAAVLSSRSPAA